MDDHGICGMARLHGESFAAASRLRMGLRALARGDRARAEALVPASFQRGPGDAVCVEAGAYLHARFQRDAGTGSESACELARQALLARARELDAQITLDRPERGDDAMWRARAMVERSQAALALDEPALAATLAEGAIEKLSGLWGPDHLEVGSYCDDLATALLALGRGEEAEAAVARARAISERTGLPHRDFG